MNMNMNIIISLMYGVITFLFAAGPTYHASKSQHALIRWIFTPLFGIAAIIVVALTFWFLSPASSAY